MIRLAIAVAALFFATAAYAQKVQDVPIEPLTSSTKPFVYTPKPTDILIGQKGAPVTVVEYASLSCPHCAHFYTTVLPDLTTKYIDTGKVLLVYRDYPLNTPAMNAAKLIQCADKDRRHAFLKVLFTTQKKWVFDPGTQSLANIAALGGMSKADFDACMANEALTHKIFEVAQEAERDYKVTSTPTFFINGKTKQGDHDLVSMSQAIDNALAQTQKK